MQSSCNLALSCFYIYNSVMHSYLLTMYHCPCPALMLADWVPMPQLDTLDMLRARPYPSIGAVQFDTSSQLPLISAGASSTFTQAASTGALCTSTLVRDIGGNCVYHIFLECCVMTLPRAHS